MRLSEPQKRALDLLEKSPMTIVRYMSYPWEVEGNKAHIRTLKSLERMGLVRAVVVVDAGTTKKRRIEITDLGRSQVLLSPVGGK